MNLHLGERKGQLSEKNEALGKQRKNSLFLYFDNPKTKKREYMFLDLYVFDKPKSHIQKDHNKETRLLAEQIRAKKLLELQSTNHGFVSKSKGSIGLLNFFEQTAEKRKEVDGTYGNWYSTFKHLNNFCNGRDIELKNVDETFIENFKDYLLKAKISSHGDRLSKNSAQSYFNKFRATIREAHRQKIIVENPCLRVKAIKEEETLRQYLTLEELKKLQKTECYYPQYKDAFLFSALTGLRFSDIVKLRKKDISFDEINGWSIKFTQQKTKGVEILPISENAITIIDIDSKDDDDLVFTNLKYSAHYNTILRKWIEEAGIKKYITFHCARHSFATLQLTMNTDIYTVSKLLGHRHLKTTEIYAKVIDKKKIDAVSSIPNIFE
ncbi:tyrosine-type recombinase/integrase [Empedobacter brevis]|uniref:tyrosine-type recombinase/integrase n=1 Tax=Empedobacter brevis TaxID=247 RepID=UPI00289ECCEE|nr:site-specific integrase [Empedobacter brevis]